MTLYPEDVSEGRLSLQSQKANGADPGTMYSPAGTCFAQKQPMRRTPGIGVRSIILAMRMS